MALKRLDHVNLRTAKLDQMVEFYEQILGLESGERPPFPFPGAWLYCGGEPVVHLVGIEAGLNTVEPRIEHFAFEAAGMSEFVSVLEAAKVEYEKRVVPGFGTIQVNLYDPDGNHIHVDFPPQEAEMAGAA